MRNAGAAKRREQEQDQPPDGAAIEADLRRIIDATDGVVAGLRRHDRAIASVVGKLEKLAAECPNAEHLAFLADKIGTRQAQVMVELISLAGHSFENREAFELYVQTAAFTETMRQAAVAEATAPLLAEIAELRKAAAPRARHAARKRHLRVAGGIAAGGAVAASLVTGTAVVATHDSASVHAYAASRPSVRVHAGRPDSAVLIPRTPSSSAPYVPKHAKPSADAASASPAPSPSLPAPTVSPPSPVPSSQPPAEAPGVLDVQTAVCAIGVNGTCTITFTAVGGPVWWSASSSSPDVVIKEPGGWLADGQPGVITVTVRAGALAGSGVVALTDGRGNSAQVAVTWAAVPGLAL